LLLSLFGIHFQRILFIALLEIYLAVRIVETESLYLPPSSTGHTFIAILNREVLSYHIDSQQTAMHSFS
jgi:hypothetical protein